MNETRRPVVLVAEDDPSVRMTLEFVLEDEGFGVLVAENGEEALRLSMTHRPDAILLDQVMPKMDGRRVHAALRADAATRSIPVFVLTGMVRSDEDEWPGAHFIGKPFSSEELVERIRASLRGT